MKLALKQGPSHPSQLSFLEQDLESLPDRGRNKSCRQLPRLVDAGNLKDQDIQKAWLS